jgi:hypothetical protein
VAPTAHVAWYVDDPFGADLELELLTAPVTLAMLAGVVLVAVVWRVVARRLPVPELPVLAPLGRLVPWVPRILAIHVGVSLLALAVTDTYLAPHLELAGIPGGWLVALGQGVIGVWLITGVALRPAAWAVVALGPLGLLLEGPVPVLERVDLLGLALFLALLPPGADAYGARPVTPAALHRPLLALRAGVGVSLTVLAFSEKLLVPTLARELLADRALDPFQLLGLTNDPDLFIRVASATELLLGLLFLSGAAPQVVVLAAAIPFNLTLAFFDRFELIGHLPVYGAMLALLVYGSSPAHAAVTWRFRSPEPDEVPPARVTTVRPG